MLTSFMTLFQVFKFVCIAITAFEEKPLTPFSIHIEVEHGLEGATPTGIFGEFAQVLSTGHTTHKHSDEKQC